MKNELNKIINEIQKYEDGKLSFTKTQLEKLYEQKYDLIKKIKKTCQHKKCKLVSRRTTDSGYGCDRNYYHLAIHCEECDEDIIEQEAGREFSFWINKHRPLTLQEIIEDCGENFSDEQLERVGYYRHEERTVTIRKRK